MINSHCPTAILLMRSVISGNMPRSVKPTLNIWSQLLPDIGHTFGCSCWHQWLVSSVPALFCHAYADLDLHRPVLFSVQLLFEIVWLWILSNSSTFNPSTSRQHGSLKSSKYGCFNKFPLQGIKRILILWRPLVGDIPVLLGLGRTCGK